MAAILRGQVWWASLESAQAVVGHEQGNPRPILVLSNDHFNGSTQLVIAALITSIPPGSPRVPKAEIRSIAMPKQSWVLPGQVRTLSTQRLTNPIGKLSDQELQSITQAIFQILTN